MLRRQRLIASLRGEPVDRPPVNFYEINALDQNPDDPDPFNVFSDPSWKPLLDLARERSDRIVMRFPAILNAAPNSVEALTERETWEDEHGSRCVRTTIHAPGRTLTMLERRDRDIDTVWRVEHLLKDVDDFRAWIALPHPEFSGEVDTSGILAAEAELGDSGIVMIDTSDPLCDVAMLMDMGTFTIIAMTEHELMHAALEKIAAHSGPCTEAVARALPGRLWRVYGPEFAAPPYLPPALFADYATRYDTPMVASIQRHGGFARIHSHGRLRDVLDHIAATGCTALDPIEPPPQGDVELRYVRERYGRQMTLFGNLEISDIEGLPTPAMREKVRTALQEGAQGEGRGFVLMPSSAPYGRKLPEQTLRNYEAIVEMAERFGG
jgi:hypothetical protein